MTNQTHILAAIAVMTAVTLSLRVLPFIIFGKRETPSYIVYLGRFLPYAIMGMLVVYCLKGISITKAPFAIPEALGVICVAGMHVWRRNTLLSIASGLFCYMALIRIM